jgi:hypothetical protein
VVNRTRLPRCLWIYTSRGCLERGKDGAVFCIAAPAQPALAAAPASPQSPCGSRGRISSAHLIENKNPRSSRTHANIQCLDQWSLQHIHSAFIAAPPPDDFERGPDRCVICWTAQCIPIQILRCTTGHPTGSHCTAHYWHVELSAATLPVPTNTKRAPEAIVCTRLPPWKNSGGAEFRYDAHPDTAPPFRRRRNSPSAADIPAYRAWSATLS